MGPTHTRTHFVNTVPKKDFWSDEFNRLTAVVLINFPESLQVLHSLEDEGSRPKSISTSYPHPRHDATEYSR